MDARYLTSCPCREPARPARCAQGFSTPRCERLARNITEDGQARSHVPIADRERHAYMMEGATCFWCIACSRRPSNSVRVCRVSRFAIGVARVTLRRRLRRAGTGPRCIAVAAGRDEAIAPKRPSGRRRRCCGAEMGCHHSRLDGYSSG